ncbi:HAD-IA family hydrolase [Streptomyces sp. NPDC058394]|uniref:HAD-IA family hydrolase n=1 Tax=Streptomyces sp. NPDC058394 TaxID=3346477 RepID=UPI0036699453
MPEVRPVADDADRLLVEGGHSPTEISAAALRGIAKLYPAHGGDVHVVSQQVGMAKPDPAIHRLNPERIGLPAERCVFMDDHAVNLPPAAELGITTVHATGEDTAVAELRYLWESVRSLPQDHVWVRNGAPARAREPDPGCGRRLGRKVVDLHGQGAHYSDRMRRSPGLLRPTVSPHEAGHISGPRHVGSGHECLTMFTISCPC